MRGLLFMAARYPLGQFIIGLLCLFIGLWSLIAIIIDQITKQPLTSSDITIGWTLGLVLTILGAFSWVVCYIGLKRRRQAKLSSNTRQ